MNEIQIVIDRILWLTETIFPTIVFCCVSLLMTYLTRDAPSEHDLLASTHSYLLMAVKGFWYVTAALFAAYLLRKLLFNR